jgi:hypothetical protein
MVERWEGRQMSAEESDPMASQEAGEIQRPGSLSLFWRGGRRLELRAS